jgi:uncharacterized protein DUF1844
MSNSEQDGTFKVSDKRKFTSEGEPRAESNETIGETSGPQSEAEAPAAQRTAPKDSSSTEDFQMTFETLVMSLSSTAMVQLGLIPDPATNQPEQNLPAARQTIDILEILQDKTKGNLDESESKLLDNILYELRMTFLEVNQSIQKP